MAVEEGARGRLAGVAALLLLAATGGNAAACADSTIRSARWVRAGGGLIGRGRCPLSCQGAGGEPRVADRTFGDMRASVGGDDSSWPSSWPKIIDWST
jgi:hypothetical protein